MTDPSAPDKPSPDSEAESAAPSMAAAPGDDAPHRRWSRKVLLMRFLFPAAAVFLVALVVLWARWQDSDDGFKLGFTIGTPEDAKTLRMVNARFAGTNKSAQPYLLTADEALQGSADDDIIRLRNPKGDITTKDGAWVALAAPQGQYSQSREILDLAGGVKLFHDSGMEFNSATARINLKTNTARGKDPVFGQGPSIDITSEGFEVLDEGQRIIFTGKAKAVLYPKDKRTRTPRRRLDGKGRRENK